jgi:hypothetical protein
MNEIAVNGKAEITVDHGRYEANAEALERIKLLSDGEFEKEIAEFPQDTQTFLRIARDHKRRS